SLVAHLACDLGTVARLTMRRPCVGIASLIAVLLVVALGHRWSVTASWFTSDKTCRERHATPWLVESLDIDCDRLLRARLWKLYDEGQFWPLRRGPPRPVACAADDAFLAPSVYALAPRCLLVAPAFL